MSTPVIASGSMRPKKKRAPQSEISSPPRWTVHHTSTQSPYEDDCEEFVPLSQDINPMGNVSYVGMMSSTVNLTPKMYKGGSPNFVGIPEVSQVDVNVTASAGDPVSTSPPAAGTEIRDATQGGKRSRAALVIWDDITTHTLIRHYEEAYIHINRGNLRSKDWEDVTFALNRDVDGSFNSEQVKNRIDFLKRTHKKTKTQQNSTGAAPSKFQFYNLCECLWGSSPKVTGLIGALDSDARRCDSANAGFNDPQSPSTNEPAHHDGGRSKQTSIPIPDAIDLDGVVGKKAKQAKRSSLGAVSRTMGETMKEMCSTIREAEEKRSANLKEVEANRLAFEEARLASEERIALKREEEETKRIDIQARMQFELGKLFAKHAD